MGSVVYPWIGYNLLCASTLGRWAGALPILWVILLSYVYIQIFFVFLFFFSVGKKIEKAAVLQLFPAGKKKIESVVSICWTVLCS